MTLRPYQREAVDAVYRHLRERDDNPCVVLPTASGKTPVMATICRDAVQLWNGRVLILAHVKELLGQAAEKLQLVAPDLPVGIYSAGLNRRDLGYPVTIAGIQSVYQKACDIGPVDLVIVDECFVAGTSVSTPAGEMPIELIQPGMFVRNATGMGKVLATSARAPSELVTLEYSDGTTITCTPGHPIFTESGWKPATTLEIGSLAFGVASMRVLRAGVPPVDQATAGREPHNPERASLAKAAVLLDLVFQNPQQLHEIAGSQGEGQPHDEGKRARSEDSGRQRPTNRSARKDAEADGRWLGRGICGAGAGLRITPPAQASEDRRRTTGDDDRHRTGRPKSPLADSPPAGLPKDYLSGAKRLVRISRHEPARDRVVFNLHVSGHPSYFANGVLAHNCHLIPEDGEGMYRQLLADMSVVNPNVRVIGLTATPFRMKSGTICAPDNILNAICYEVGVRELIVQGYLCGLRTKAGLLKPDTEQLHVRGGEYIAGEVEDLMDDQNLVLSACREIVEYTHDRNSVLIFASGVTHGQHIAEILRTDHGAECGFVCGETPNAERDAILERFKSGDLKYLCNINVLTTGFDATRIDCVALVRPTLSPGLYYQMCGRGFRLHPGKTDCLVLDFGGNVLRHGPVDAIRVTDMAGPADGEAPAKECPECRSVIAAGYSICPDCGYVFPERRRSEHDPIASSEGILSDQIQRNEFEVLDTYYAVHEKRNAAADAPRTLRVEYKIGFNDFVSEWVCFEHDGFARQKAESWWLQRSHDPIPATAERAVELAEAGAIAPALSITVERKPGDRFERVVGYKLGPKPASPEYEDDVPWYAADPADEEVPF